MPDRQLARPLPDRLQELRLDVDALPLAGAADVRARGDRRGRRQKAALGVGSGLAVVAVGLAVTGVLGGDRSIGVQPAGPDVTVTRTVTVTPTVPGTVAATSPFGTTAAQPKGVGSVPRPYFLPGDGWTGPDLDSGLRVDVVTLREADGVAWSACDVDTAMTGDVMGVEAVHPDGNHVGYQKVRLLGSDAAAVAAAGTLRRGLLGCAGRDGDRGHPSTELAQLRVRDASGSVDVVRSSLHAQLELWDVVARQGRAVSLVTLQVYPTSDVTTTALRRIAAAARTQMAAAQR